ncbi:MAG: chemotaxis protein CheD [Acidobacteriaceae bacterium]|jgi:chemotaxis protein CheD
MPDPEMRVPEVHVQPGESHLVREPVILRTVLGSCVGVTFWAPRLGLAALCHPMLPMCPVKGAARMSLDAGRRYVDFAIRDLVRQFDAFAARRGEIEVKLFGGGDVLLVSNENSRPTVGRLNCEAALRVLREEGFHVVASSLGGTAGLHIQFHTGTGEVLLRRLG